VRFCDFSVFVAKYESLFCRNPSKTRQDLEIKNGGIVKTTTEFPESDIL
jgi:hypothetical protein